MPIIQGCHPRQFFYFIYIDRWYRYLHANFHEDWPKKLPDFINLKQASILFRSHCTFCTLSYKLFKFYYEIVCCLDLISTHVCILYILCVYFFLNSIQWYLQMELKLWAYITLYILWSTVNNIMNCDVLIKLLISSLNAAAWVCPTWRTSLGPPGRWTTKSTRTRRRKRYLIKLQKSF